MCERAPRSREFATRNINHEFIYIFILEQQLVVVAFCWLFFLLAPASILNNSSHNSTKTTQYKHCLLVDEALFAFGFVQFRKFSLSLFFLLHLHLFFSLQFAQIVNCFCFAILLLRSSNTNNNEKNEEFRDF